MEQGQLWPTSGKGVRSIVIGSSANGTMHICGTGWGGLHCTLSVFLYGGQCCCVCCNEWYCSRTNGWLSTQLHEGHFYISFLLHSLSLVDFKLLMFNQISKLNLVPSHVSGPSPAVGLLVHMSWTRTHTTQHCQV